MKWTEFVSQGKNRVLPVIVEVYGKKYPHYASKLYPICYTSFNDLGILFTPCGLLRRKKKRNLQTVRYKEIVSVEFNVQRVPTVFLYLLGSSLHFSLFPELVKLLKKHKVFIKDPLKLQSILKEQHTMEKFYSYLDQHLETDPHHNGREPKIK